MTSETPIGDGSNNNETHISTTTGMLGLVHDLGNIADTAYQKMHELWSFDDTLHSILVTLARDINLLETCCRAIGYSLPMTAASGDDLSIPARTQAQTTELESHLQLPRAKETMELSLASSIDLLKRILEGLGHVSTTNMAKIDAFINSLGTSNIHLAQHGPDSTIELGQAGAVPSQGALVDTLRRLNILQDSLPLRRKATSVFKKLLPHIDTLVKRLEDQILILEMFVIGAKLDILIQVPPRLVELQVIRDCLPQVIEGTMEKLQHRQIYEAAINSYLFMREIPPSDTLGDFMLHHYIEDLVPVLRATEETGWVVTFRNSPCFVEWILDIVATRESEQINIESRLSSLVYRLSMVSSDDYRILPPINFIQDSREEQVQYGLLYQLPDSFDAENDTIVSLASLFDSPSFPLEQRFKLAFGLANALRQFQTCQWLHEKISADNVVFVARNGSAANVSLHEPYIKGFGTSRLHTADSDKRASGSLENDYYQHPLRRQRVQTGPRAGKAMRRYRAEFDIYSLGRILLEIGAWDFVDDDELDESLQHLPSDVGSMYTDAVLWCLGMRRHSPVTESRLISLSDVNQPELGWSPLLIGLYEENVLMKIAECRV
ncbi:Fc.00g055320.m01.CDS01 [Cosmosporella sp. VM-42]